MNVNIKVSLTDIERNTMYKNLFGGTSAKMVSRADVNEYVKKKVQEALVQDCVEVPVTQIGEKIADAMSESISDNFKPSRGDEPYMFKAKDESLRAIHTRMLDCIEEYESAVWTEMEKNRA